MAKRAAIDPEILKKIEEQEPTAMADEDVLGIFEHLAIVFAKNPRSRGAWVFKQRFRALLLEHMEHEDREHPPRFG